MVARKKMFSGLYGKGSRLRRMALAQMSIQNLGATLALEDAEAVAMLIAALVPPKPDLPKPSVKLKLVALAKITESIAVNHFHDK